MIAPSSGVYRSLRTKSELAPLRLRADLTYSLYCFDRNANKARHAGREKLLSTVIKPGDNPTDILATVGDVRLRLNDMRRKVHMNTTKMYYFVHIHTIHLELPRSCP